MTGRLNVLVVILLFAFISILPLPLFDKYSIFIKWVLFFMCARLFIIKRSAIFHAVDLPLWVFLALASLNIFYTSQISVAIDTYLKLSVPLILLYYLISETPFTHQRFVVFAKAVCVSSFAVALFAVLESFFAVNPVYKYYISNPFYQRYITGFVRPMATQFNPAALGTYLIVSLPFNLFIMRHAQSRLRVVAHVNMVVLIVANILTFSRGNFIGFIVMVLLFLLSEKRYRAMAGFIILIAAFIALCFFLPYPFTKFGEHLIPSPGKSILSDYIVNRWVTAFRMVHAHPFVGLGFQHFRIEFNQFYPGTDIVPWEKMIADNMYLTLLAETGILGFCGFMFFLISFLRRGIRRLQYTRLAEDTRQQIFTVLLALSGFLLNLAGYEMFYWTNQYFLFCILVGLLAGLIKEGHHAHGSHQKI